MRSSLLLFSFMAPPPPLKRFLNDNSSKVYDKHKHAISLVFTREALAKEAQKKLADAGFHSLVDPNKPKEISLSGDKPIYYSIDLTRDEFNEVMMSKTAFDDYVKLCHDYRTNGCSLS